MKVCNKCKQEKELSDFGKRKDSKDGASNTCIKCASIARRLRTLKTKEDSLKKIKKRANKINKEREEYKKNREVTLKKHREERNELIVKQKKEYEENRDEYEKKEIKTRNETTIKKRKDYYEKNKDIFRLKNKKWKENNEKKNKDYQRNYHKIYQVKNKQKRAEWTREKMKTDVFFKFKNRLRSNITKAIKGKGYTKRSKAFDILGIDFNGFQTYISSKFKDGMTFENHGEWHLDHIMPMASANTEEEAIKLNHYTNFQPLWASENLKKSDKINGVSLRRAKTTFI